MSSCQSIISVYRALPVNPSDPVDSKYLSVQGQIVNNVFNGSVYVPGTPANTTPPPVSLNLPTYTPEVSGPRPVDCPEDSRYVATQCGPLTCSIGDCDVNPLFTLASLAFLLKNNLTCNIIKVDPCQFLSLGSESGIPFYKSQNNCFNSPLSNSACPDINSTCTLTSCQYNYTECGSTSVLPGSYEYDGLLAAVYTIGHFKSYSFLPSTRDVLELYICPYNAANTSDGTTSVCNSNVLGTAPFCIGHSTACAYVNLLQFSSATCIADPECIDPSDPSDPSDGSQVFSQLVWVQVKITTRNRYGHICVKKPYSLEIEAAENDPLADCYKPYFAFVRECHINSHLDNSSCNGGPFPTQCSAFTGCPYPIPGTSAVPTPALSGISGGVILPIIFVNHCVEISELKETPSCKVFIVLIPTAPTLPL